MVVATPEPIAMPRTTTAQWIIKVCDTAEKLTLRSSEMGGLMLWTGLFHLPR